MSAVGIRELLCASGLLVLKVATRNIPISAVVDGGCLLIFVFVFVLAFAHRFAFAFAFVFF